MDGPDSDDVESCHPDSSDFEDERYDEGLDKNKPVTVENLAADRKSLSMKIKTTLSKRYETGTRDVFSSKDEFPSTTLTSSNVPKADMEEGVDNSKLGEREPDKPTDKNSKIKATPHCQSQALSIDKGGNVSSKNFLEVEVNGDGIDEKSSALSVSQTIDHGPRGFAQPKCAISELINNIGSTVYRCTKCDIDRKNFTEWKSHLKLHNIDVRNLSEGERSSLGECIPDFKCVICGLDFKRKRDLHVHLKSHENAVSCDVCGLMFMKVKELKIHMRYHDFTEHQCHICKKSFLDKNMLVRHITTHSTEKLKRDRHELLCEICSRMFNAPNLLAIHLKSHKNLSSFRCENCDLTFKRRLFLDKHMREIHNNIKDSIVCRFCLTQFDNKDDLNQHLKENLCDQRFSWKNKKLLNFRKTTYKCRQCDKVMYRKTQFDAHMRKHSGDKPYICDVCGVGFSVASSLKKHQLIHSGSKPHECHHCGKCFLHNSSFIRHLRIHSGEKPYVCKTCGKGFRASCYLKTHQHVHGTDGNGDQVKTLCSICHKEYRYIEKHMKSHFKNHFYDTKSFTRDLIASTSFIPITIPPLFTTTSTSESIEQAPKRIKSSETVSCPVDNTSTFLKVLGAAYTPTFGEKLDDTSPDCELAAISNNINKSSSQDVSDDDGEGIIGFDNDDNDHDFSADNSVSDHISLSGTSDDNPMSLHSNLHTPEPHSEQEENPEDTLTCQTTEDKNVNLEKIQEVASQSEELCQDICKGSEELEKTAKSPVKKMDIVIGEETPYKEKCEPTEVCGNELRSSQRTKLIPNDGNNQIKNNKSENTEVTSIQEADFNEVEDDDTETDSIIQNAILRLDNLKEDMSNDVEMKPEKRRKHQLKCDVCGDKFKNASSYEAHLQTHTDMICDFFETDNGIYNCKKCDKKCKTKRTAFAHSRFHLGIAPFACDICDESFELEDLLKEHYLCHGTYKRFRCQYCNKGFHRSCRLKRHLLSHENARNYMCETCGGKYNTPGYLREHMKIHGIAAEEKCRKQRNRYKAKAKRQCPVCGKLVKELETHLLNHKKERNFQCAHCDKAFVSFKKLNKHTKVHLGNKKWICPYTPCGRGFFVKSELDRHLICHEKNKAFNSLKCDYCVAVYSSETDLEKHLKLHKSSKWSCDICNRVFEKQNKLKAHVIVHTRQKPYKCDLCKAAFTQKGSLQRHMRERHAPKIII